MLVEAKKVVVEGPLNRFIFVLGISTIIVPWKQNIQIPNCLIFHSRFLKLFLNDKEAKLREKFLFFPI